MAWSSSGQSGFYLQTIIAALTGVSQTTGSINLLTSSAQNLSLVTGTAVSYTTAPLQYGGSVANTAWVNTNEITPGTGYVSGGWLLSTAYSTADVIPTTTITGSGPYVLTYTWTHPVTVATTTISGIYGCIIYNNAITAPAAKPMYLALYFGSTAYATVAGTFGITPSGSGLAAITLTA
jgi:hypothetical protein